MSELSAVVQAARALRQSGEPYLLATVVSVQGPSYRRPGARLLIAGDRVVAGSISGGCLEQELTRRGWWLTREGRPVLLTFDSSREVDDDGAPAALAGEGGVVEILLERITPDRSAGGQADDALALLEAVLAEQSEVALLTVFRSTRPEVVVGTRRVLPVRWRAGQPSVETAPPALAALMARARRALGEPGKEFAMLAFPDGSVAALAEWLRPPPHLFLFGAGPDVVPVVVLARGLGWTVTVWDPRARPHSRVRFTAADHVQTRALVGVRVPIDASHCPLAVVMSHDREVDRRAIEMLIASRARYIGVLGPRGRSDRLLAELASSGVDVAGAAARLHAPVGLAIGAETPDEIALSIIAQAQLVAADARAPQGADVKFRSADADQILTSAPLTPRLVAQ